jgi:hypothetical protein
MAPLARVLVSGSRGTWPAINQFLNILVDITRIGTEINYVILAKVGARIH